MGTVAYYAGMFRPFMGDCPNYLPDSIRHIASLCLRNDEFAQILMCNIVRKQGYCQEKMSKRWN